MDWPIASGLLPAAAEFRLPEMVVLIAIFVACVPGGVALRGVIGHRRAALEAAHDAARSALRSRRPLRRRLRPIAPSDSAARWPRWATSDAAIQIGLTCDKHGQRGEDDALRTLDLR